MPVRLATIDDIPALARVINRACVVEAHLFHGDRTDEAELRERLEKPNACFLVIDVGDLRTELPAFYTRLGYVAAGSTPYASETAKVPVRLVRMTKVL